MNIKKQIKYILLALPITVISMVWSQYNLNKPPKIEFSDIDEIKEGEMFIYTNMYEEIGKIKIEKKGSKIMCQSLNGNAYKTLNVLNKWYAKEKLSYENIILEKKESISESYLYGDTGQSIILLFKVSNMNKHYLEKFPKNNSNVFFLCELTYEYYKYITDDFDKSVSQLSRLANMEYNEYSCFFMQ